MTTKISAKDFRFTSTYERQPVTFCTKGNQTQTEASMMKRNGMINKRILGVSGRNDILLTIEEKILEAYPKCLFDKVTTLQKARRLMMLYNYSLLVLDEANLNELNRSGASMIQNFPVVVLTDDGVLFVDQVKSFASNVYGYLPKNCLETTSLIISNLLNVEFVPQWQIPFKRYGGIFNLGTVEAIDKLCRE